MLETQASIAKACSRSSAVMGSKCGIWPANLWSSMGGAAPSSKSSQLLLQAGVVKVGDGSGNVVPNHRVGQSRARVGEVIRHSEEQHPLVQNILLRSVYGKIEVKPVVSEVAAVGRAAQNLFDVHHPVISNLSCENKAQG